MIDFETTFYIEILMKKKFLLGAFRGAFVIQCFDSLEKSNNQYFGKLSPLEDILFTMFIKNAVNISVRSLLNYFSKSRVKKHPKPMPMEFTNSPNQIWVIGNRYRNDKPSNQFNVW